MLQAIIPVFGASAASLWAAALVAAPRKPLPNNEVEELVYSRLLGRQHRVALLALMITAVGWFMLIAQLPSRNYPVPERMQSMDGTAGECVDVGGTCITRRMDGTLHVVS